MSWCRSQPGKRKEVREQREKGLTWELSVSAGKKALSSLFQKGAAVQFWLSFTVFNGEKRVSNTRLMRLEGRRNTGRRQALLHE